MQAVLVTFVILAIFVLFMVASITSVVKRSVVRAAIRKNVFLFNQLRQSNDESNYHLHNQLAYHSLINLQGRLKSVSRERLEYMVDREIKHLSSGVFLRFLKQSLLIFKFVALSAGMLVGFITLLFLIIDTQVNSTNDHLADANTASTSPIVEEIASNPLDQQDATVEKEKADQEAYESGLASYHEEQFEEALTSLEAITDSSSFYTQSQELIKDIHVKLYWSQVLYPTYDEITKSPEKYTGSVVGFSGTIIDILEVNNKTMMIIGTEIMDEYYEYYGGDVLVLYPEHTELMEGDILNFSGMMKGNYLQTNEEYLISNYLGGASSFSTSGFENTDQMPVVIADYLY
ncbi:hypothetical protein [Jeotgalibacillus sp. R-1-5s-1]|uniref:hypothetical protein n=1 Tax=Jeotgalibacillus sp. R-1-5s-1 TaxID=2555897 RepID=UPI00106A4167|nr:hypothetical protein [Jeotgalibacillus sp. R-1-5s-1]TFD97065.1 hypothetical protein E2491_10255 [Jeotgalibacillus sp. R-1-5s-1]